VGTLLNAPRCRVGRSRSQRCIDEIAEQLTRFRHLVTLPIRLAKVTVRLLAISVNCRSQLTFNATGALGQRVDGGRNAPRLRCCSRSDPPGVRSMSSPAESRSWLVNAGVGCSCPRSRMAIAGSAGVIGELHLLVEIRGVL